MAADWVSIEAALQAWVAAAGSFDNAHARWAEPNTERPAGTFATLQMLSRRPLGAVPEMVQVYHEDLDVPDGLPVELQATQVLDCALRVSVRAPPARGTHPGTPKGTASAGAIAEQIRLSAALPTQIDNLDAVGVSIFEMGHVQEVDAIVGTDFEGVAFFDCRFYVSNFASESTSYIDSVVIDEELDDTDEGTFVADAS